jgi:uncharacterized membrane protein YbhN (UPF0104 family)
MSDSSSKRFGRHKPPNLAKRSRRWIRLVLSGLAAAALLGLVAWLADFRDLQMRLQQADYSLLALSLVAYSGTYFARARRFAAAGAKATTMTLLAVVTIHGALNRLMPLRTGELSYPMLARKVGAAGLGEGLVQLLMLRIIDLVTVALLFLLALVMALVMGVEGLGQGTGAFVGAASMISGLCLVALFRLGWILRFGLDIARMILKRLGGGVREKGLGVVAKAEEAVTAVTTLSLKDRGSIVFWSVICWSLYFVVFHLILMALQVPLPFLRTVLGSSAAIVGSTLPISGLGTFGALEGGWTAGFVAVGLDTTTAASTALVMSGLTLVFALILAVFGWLWLSARERSEGDSRSERSEPL